MDNKGKEKTRRASANRLKEKKWDKTKSAPTGCSSMADSGQEFGLYKTRRRGEGDEVEKGQQRMGSRSVEENRKTVRWGG